MRAKRRFGRSAAGAAAGAAAWCIWRLYTTEVPTYVDTDSEHLVGAYHLHTDLSHDSHIPEAAYVGAAHTLGLDFIVITDHNAQRAPSADSPQNSQNSASPGVTRASPAVCVVASAELSTPFGHVVGLGAHQVASAEVRGDAGVLGAIETLGGVAIIAHPTDGKRPWTGPYPSRGGLEIANWSASVRRQSAHIWPALPLAAMAWGLNRPLVSAQAYDRDDDALALWDRPEHAALAGFCAIDAHGWIAPRDNLYGWQLVLSRVLRRDAAHAGCDRRAEVLQALRGGHFFCAATLATRPPALLFAAMQKAQVQASHGDSVAQRDVDLLAVQVPDMAHSATRLVVRRDGAIVYEGPTSRWQLAHPAPGIYRIELWADLPQLIGPPRATPVLYSNKLTVTA